MDRGGDLNAGKVTVGVEGRTLALSNLEKVLYPRVGFTKSEVIDYYARIAPVLLPHVEGRPLTFKRYPDGVDAPSFFEKNAASHAPEWVATVTLPSPSSTKDRSEIRYAVLDSLPALVWAANLATLELHVPMWRVDGRGRRRPPDRLVFDLDPGAPANVVDCCRVALLVRGILDEDRLVAYPKTSGGKGLHLQVPLRPRRSWEEVHAYARRVAERLAREHSRRIVSTMAKQARRGKVLVDWSQNHQAKTTVAPYSLRAREEPTVSVPVTWDEVEGCAEGGTDSLRFGPQEVLDRVDVYGDLHGDLLSPRRSLPVSASRSSRRSR
ncbi:MAG: non-homologous end-joining DNA ligase [Streptosporangiaceae bacterium]